jgi:hypothetical protein
VADIALSEPQFQLYVNRETGEKTGRIYFPGLFLFENWEKVKEWLSLPHIYFTQTDMKLYGDGSFRLFFKAPEPTYRKLLARFGTRTVARSY